MPCAKSEESSGLKPEVESHMNEITVSSIVSFFPACMMTPRGHQSTKGSWVSSEPASVYAENNRINNLLNIV